MKKGRIDKFIYEIYLYNILLMITTPFWYNDISILYSKDSIMEIFPSKRFDILRKLGQEGITSILVEGGQKVHKSFIDADLIDEFYIYTSNKILDDAKLDNPFKINENWDLTDKIYLDEDILTIVKKKKLCLQES